MQPCKMDIMKYYEVSHHRHQVFNPMGMTKFEGLMRSLRLQKGSKILDMACGSGEYLVRLAELYGISGVGVDRSHAFIVRCRENMKARTPGSDLKFIEMDGASYEPGGDGPFDLSMCIGAEWIYKGTIGTIRAMKAFTKDGGLVAIGSPYWLKEPSEEYLKLTGIKREDYGDFSTPLRLGEAEGMSCVNIVASDPDDWDHYETLQWLAVDEYIRENPQDPDNPELRRISHEFKEHYLRGGREYMNWAIFIFRN